MGRKGIIGKVGPEGLKVNKDTSVSLLLIYDTY